ncbi:hypothetical protein PU630_01690 [Microbacterium horticulturae]|uniref:DUF4352 domain-containing protein n=1 Tax=Microbacterium horticulturae TaxID=3028316 RepID=A0ABY8C2M0_9MICO|nr:hypothetical protein [Microbacterium sp. KACC 23027]WEG09301.1 hypothetical protein PU630_01690 [Microbacterium sp. KACC 23027]
MKRHLIAGLALVAALATTGCSAVAAASASPSTEPDVVYPDGYGPDDASEADEPTDPVETTPDVGTLDNPYPQGEAAVISQDDEDYYSVAFTLADADADKEVAAANQFNDKAPSGFHYVVVEATFTGLSSEAVDPAVEMWDWQIADQDGNLYQSASIVTDTTELDDAPELHKGQKYTGVEVYAVPDATEALYMSALGSYVAL